MIIHKFTNNTKVCVNEDNYFIKICFWFSFSLVLHKFHIVKNTQSTLLETESSASYL